MKKHCVSCHQIKEIDGRGYICVECKPQAAWCKRCKSIVTPQDYRESSGACKACDAKRAAQRQRNRKTEVKAKNAQRMREKAALDRGYCNLPTTPESKTLTYLANKYNTDTYTIADLLRETHCQLCGDEFTVCADGRRGSHIDHCHKNGTVRGVVCPQCNVGLGQFERFRRLGLMGKVADWV